MAEKRRLKLEYQSSQVEVPVPDQLVTVLLYNLIGDPKIDDPILAMFCHDFGLRRSKVVRRLIEAGLMPLTETVH